jgi:PAS domain S-box-containing protein
MAPDRPSGPRPTILVVDDDPDICQALHDLLEHEGFTVTTANTGLEALTAVGRQAYSTVLLDVGLPDRDGLDVLTQIHHLHSDLPVIILTAFTTPDRTVGALDQGAFAYLTKPYRRDELLATLRRAVGAQALTVKAVAVEQALTMSEARFTTLVANIPGAVYRCACDPAWTMAFLSDGIADLCGYPAKDFINNAVRTYASVIHPDDRAMVERQVFDAVAQRTPYSLDYRIGHADGSVRWVYERGRGVFGPDGAVQWLDGIILDATERKEAEVILRQTEERLELAVEGSSDGLWDGRPSPDEPWWSPRTPIWWSPRLKTMLGFRGDEFPNVLESWAARLHPDDKERIFQALTEHIDRRIPYDVEYRLRTKGGEYRWYRARGQAIWNPEGQMVRMAGSLRDIHDRKQMEFELRQSQALLSAILDHLPDMVLVKDAKDLRFVHFNKAGEALLGYPREEMIGKCDADFFPPDQAAFFTAKDREVLAGGGVVDIPEEPIQTRHKGMLWLHTKKIAIRSEDGTPLYLLGISEDITDRKGKT